ncbi:hypothetical protein BDV10DRAFT_109121 [Aspergillus recurvatus]
MDQDGSVTSLGLTESGVAGKAICYLPQVEASDSRGAVACYCCGQEHVREQVDSPILLRSHSLDATMRWSCNTMVSTGTSPIIRTSRSNAIQVQSIDSRPYLSESPLFARDLPMAGRKAGAAESVDSMIDSQIDHLSGSLEAGGSGQTAATNGFDVEPSLSPSGWSTATDPFLVGVAQ